MTSTWAGVSTAGPADAGPTSSTAPTSTAMSFTGACAGRTPASAARVRASPRPFPVRPARSVVGFRLLREGPTWGADQQEQVLHRRAARVRVVVPHAGRVHVGLPGSMILDAADADRPALAVRDQRAFQDVDV